MNSLIMYIPATPYPSLHISWLLAAAILSHKPSIYVFRFFESVGFRVTYTGGILLLYADTCQQGVVNTTCDWRPRTAL
jgi:hypothetical protein